MQEHEYSGKIDITGLDKVEVVMALWNRAREVRLQKMIDSVIEVRDEGVRKGEVTYMSGDSGETHAEYLSGSLDNARKQFERESGWLGQLLARREIKANFKSKLFTELGALPTYFGIYTMKLQFNASRNIIDVGVFDHFNGGDGTAASVIDGLRIKSPVPVVVGSIEKQLAEQEESWRRQLGHENVPRELKR